MLSINFFGIFSDIVHIMLNIEPQIEKMVLHLKETIKKYTPVYCQYSKLIHIQVTLILNVCHCLLLWKSSLSPASLQPVESSQRISIDSCCTILPPVQSKATSHHHQLSNYDIHRLAHSETDMNADNWLFEHVFTMILCK